jgi:hypothetical protein
MRRVLMLAAPIVLALSLTTPVSAAEPTPGPEAGARAESPAKPATTCSNFCTMIYDPVTCELSNGETRTFGNDCEADRYACEQGLRVIGCVARRGSVAS